MSWFVSMIAFAWVGAVTPGPVNLVATSAGMTFGLKRAIPHVIGASVAYMLVVFFAGVGLSQLLVAMPWLQSAMTLVGGLFLLWLATKIATAPTSISLDDSHKKPPHFMHGALMQWLNPKAWLVASSGVGLFVTSQHSPFAALIWFSLISLVVCVIGVGTWAVLGFALRQWLANPARMRAMNWLMAGLLCAVVIPMMIQGLSGTVG